jgi:CspA family cold shock protein
VEPYYAPAVGTGFTFRFREWLRRSDEGLEEIQADRRPSAGPLRWPSFPAVNVRSGRGADTRIAAEHCGGGDPMAMTGTVKFFNGERGYGFIKPDDGGRDVFVHITAVERAGLKDLTEGQRISFEVEPDKKGKGPKAVNLVIQS